MGNTVRGPAVGGWWLLGALTAGHLVNDFYVMVLPPLLPAFRQAFAVGYVELGILSFAYTILSGVLQATVGHLADVRAWRKTVVVAGFLTFSGGFVLMAVAPTFAWLVVASLVCGLGATTFHPQATHFLTAAFPDRKGWAMGVHGWGGSIGNFLAPLAVAALVTRVGWRQALAWLAVAGLVAAGALGVLLHEPSRTAGAGRGSALSRDLLVLSLTFGCLSMVLRGLLTFLPTFLVEQGSTLARAGALTSLMLLVGLVAQPLGGHVYDRVGGRTVFVVCSAGAVLGLLGFALGGNSLAAPTAAVVGFFVYALFPVSLAMGSELARAERVGASVGLVFGVSATMAAVTPVLTGYAADLLGLRTALQLLVGLAILAILLSLALPGRAVAPAALAAAGPGR